MPERRDFFPMHTGRKGRLSLERLVMHRETRVEAKSTES